MHISYEAMWIGIRIGINTGDHWCVYYTTFAVHNQLLRSTPVLQAFAKAQERPSLRCCWSSSHPFGLGERLHSPSISDCSRASPWTRRLVQEWQLWIGYSDIEWFLGILHHVGHGLPAWPYRFFQKQIRNASFQGPMALCNRIYQTNHWEVMQNVAHRRLFWMRNTGEHPIN